ncbi:hypothetical protein TNCV_1401761 [Trichonephila clavipes]|nr:hypothetical protein TNCV_1401761 [Trichonephila clavipes]
MGLATHKLFPERINSVWNSVRVGCKTDFFWMIVSIGDKEKASPTKRQSICHHSLVVRASDSRPEDLGLMLDATKYPPTTHGVRSR